MSAKPPKVDDAMVETVKERVAMIRPHLAGLHHAIQGAVLADLMAMWIAGHYKAGPKTLEQLLDFQLEEIHKLIPHNIEIIKGRGG